MTESTGEHALEWPKGDEVLFKSDADWKSNACLNMPRPSFSLIAEGYYLSANLSAEYVVQNGREQDHLVYPITFCYRQYLELALKELIQKGRRLLSEPGDYVKRHELDRLWNTAKPILMKVWPEGPRADLEAVERILLEFQRVDPKSDAFRFPEGVNGEQPLAGLTHINIRNLANVMERLYNFFGGSVMGISTYLSDMLEMQHEGVEMPDP